jgi:DNA topoisomerase-1
MWLIIAEKDKSARRIAQILFNDIKILRKNNIPYYFSPSNKAFVLGLKGHIIEYDFPDELNDWRKTPLEALLKAKFVVKIREKNVVKTLLELAKGVERVTIATDYDREGEFIGLTAVKVIQKVNPNVRVDRVRFSALTPLDIRRAFNNPTSLDLKLAKSAEVRHKVDLLWGAVLTRLLSLSANRLGREFLSVGRVQSPTLRLIVEREEQIRSFKSKYYYNALIRVKGIYAKRRFEDESQAKSLLKSIDVVKVLNFKKNIVEEKKPIPFNTTEFLKEASRFMKPDKAMQIAESLYMDGYISYPRTDNTVYPPTINLKRLVEMFLNSEFKDYAEFVLRHGIEPSKGKKETKDHPPIHPTAVASRDELNKDEWLVYELVVKRFLATLAPKAKWEVRRVEFEHGFKAMGRKLIFAGWRLIYDYSKPEVSYIPDFKVGEVLVVEEKKVKREKTKPPSRYTTGTLIKVMESLGLGTKSTRHEIIKKLYDRKYIQGNPIKPTNLAFAVINALKEAVEVVTLPEMTAKLEKDMELIAEGKMSDKDVLKESVIFLSKVLREVDRRKLGNIIAEGIEKDKIEEINKSGIGVCPNCGGILLIKRVNKRFVGCSNYPKCRFTLPLPQKGTLRITSKVCEKHGVKILKVIEKDRKWEFCPFCKAYL